MDTSPKVHVRKCRVLSEFRFVFARKSAWVPEGCGVGGGGGGRDLHSKSVLTTEACVGPRIFFTPGDCFSCYSCAVNFDWKIPSIRPILNRNSEPQPLSQERDKPWPVSPRTVAVELPRKIATSAYDRTCMHMLHTLL